MCLKPRSVCYHLLPRVCVSHHVVTYTKLNPHVCPLSDQKDFGIHHHIREKRYGTLLKWTRGHTVQGGQGQLTGPQVPLLGHGNEIENQNWVCREELGTWTPASLGGMSHQLLLLS